MLLMLFSTSGIDFINLLICWIVFFVIILFSAGGGNRTPTPLKEPDFESGTSTNSITEASENALEARV